MSDVTEWVAQRWHGMDAGDALDAVAALQAVLDLHKSIQGHGVTICEACSETEDALFMEYPCPTVRAIAGALGVSP